MRDEETRYAEAFARALAEDVLANPPPGALIRVVIRWFEADDPLYFTLHVLGADERDEIPSEDAWYPLEWPNVDREMDRTDRVGEDSALHEAGEALAAFYERMEEEPEEWGPSGAIVGLVEHLPETLRSAGVTLGEDFAASAAHFEGWGALSVLEQIADPNLLGALRARGELPEE